MRDGAKVTLAALAALTFVVIAVVIYYGGIVGNKAEANYNKRVVTSKIQQSVRTKEFAQPVYEQFFNDCNDVVVDNLKISQAQARVAAVQAQPDDAFGQKANKVADAQADLTGLQQLQATTAARYNANAAEYTRGQFRDQNLPAHLDPPYAIQC